MSLGLIYEDGQKRILPQEKLFIPAYFDLGYQRGDAVFETILVREGMLFHVGKHVDRLLRSCKIMHHPLLLTREEVTEWARMIAFENRCDPLGTLRIVVSASTRDGLNISQESRMVIMQYPLREYPPEFYERGITLGLDKYRRSCPDAKTTHEGYARARKYKAEHAQSNYQDVLFSHLDLDGWEITECSRSNFFCVSNSSIVTPPETLDGVTRSLVESLLVHLPGGLPEYSSGDVVLVKNVFSTRTLSCFITSTTAGVMPVRQILNYDKYDMVHPWLRGLMKLYSEYQNDYFVSRLSSRD